MECFGIICIRNLRENRTRVLREATIMDMSNVKTKEVWSANNWYLFYGILFICLIIALECCVIREFFVSPINEAIGVAVILQLPCFICLLFTSLIGDWVHRTKFNLYYCNLKTGVDIDYIKENYSVEDINANGVLFVEKKDSYNFCTWKLVQGYKSLYGAEEKLFCK